MLILTFEGYSDSIDANGALVTLIAIAECLCRHALESGFSFVTVREVEACYGHCIALICHTTTHGYHTIIDFLENGALILLFKFAPILELLLTTHQHNDGLQLFISMVLDSSAFALRYVLPFLPYLAIFKLAKHSVQHICDSGLEHALLSQMKSDQDFAVQWREFKKSLESIQQYRSTCITFRPENRICDSPEARSQSYPNQRIFADDKFVKHDDRTSTRRRRSKICSNCQVMLYCSEKCQKQAWKAHKQECLAVSENFKSS